MRFVFADSMDFVDPTYDFVADRNGKSRSVHRDDEYPHEFLDAAPYDGILVSRGIVGDAFKNGKYTIAQSMRFRREGARRFLRYDEKRFPHSMMMGDCGAFTYRNLPRPPFGADDTVAFYADGGFTHGCSPDHLIFDFDDDGSNRSVADAPQAVLDRYEITLQNASEFKAAACRIGRHFTPMGVVQGWSAPSMADAAASLVRMGYDYLAIGGMVPLKIDQICRALAAVRNVIPPNVKLHVLGFGKIENLADIERHGVASFDSTSPLVRAFKDARKNYWARDAAGGLAYYTAIRIPQATENNHLKAMALEGKVDQERIRCLEQAALESVRGFSRREAALDEALNAVMSYWGQLNWMGESSPTKHSQAIDRQRQTYARTLEDRPWESCTCRVCREGGVEAMIFRSSNRNKRRGFHNLKVFHDHLQQHRAGRP
jgi:hypothetical protein